MMMIELSQGLDLNDQQNETILIMRENKRESKQKIQI